MKLSFRHLLFDLYKVEILFRFFFKTINAAISDCIYRFFLYMSNLS